MIRDFGADSQGSVFVFTCSVVEAWFSFEKFTPFSSDLISLVFILNLCNLAVFRFM